MELDGVRNNWSVRAAKASLSGVTGAGLFLLPVSVWFVLEDDASSRRLRTLMEPPTRYVIAAAMFLLSVNFIRLAVALRRGRPLVSVCDGVVEVQTFTRRRRFSATSITGVRGLGSGVGLVIDLAGGRHVRVGFQPADLSWDQVAERLRPR